MLLPHQERLARDAHNEPLLRTQRRHAQEQLVPDVEVVKRTPEGHGASHGPGLVQRPGKVRRCRGIRACVVSRQQRALGAAQQLQDIVWHAEASVVHGIDSRPLQTSSRPSLCSTNAPLRGGRRGYKPDVDIAEQRILLHSDGPRGRVHVLQELLHVGQRDVRGCSCAACLGEQRRKLLGKHKHRKCLLTVLLHHCADRRRKPRVGAPLGKRTYLQRKDALAVCLRLECTEQRGTLDEIARCAKDTQDLFVCSAHKARPVGPCGSLHLVPVHLRTSELVPCTVAVAPDVRAV